MIRHVAISISDPWEIGEGLGWPVFNGEIHFEEDSPCGIFHFHNPIRYKQKRYPIAIVHGRHDKFTAKNFDSCQVIPCTAVCIPSEEVAEPMRFVQMWRGHGLTFTGAITPVELQQNDKAF